jgi:exopolyphosphatase / guanosine-5'-triphosphate,3'-diphosphate pyrophosphatase
VAGTAPRVAAVDIGTNSTRLLVTDGTAVLARRTVVTRLGEGVDASRRVLPQAADRVFAALEGYRRELEALGAEGTLAVGTSAVRDAANGAELMREVADRFGFETRVLSGAEEAELTLAGVGAQDERTLVLDVGGGSTELIAGTYRTSLDVGSVRLAERFVRDDPPPPAQLAQAAAFVDAQLPELDVRACVGVGGTVAQLHVLAGELTREAVEGELERLAALPLAERRRVPGLDPDRAPVIVTGALIVREALRRYGLPSVAYSERDLLDGIAQIMLRLRHLA